MKGLTFLTSVVTQIVCMIRPSYKDFLKVRRDYSTTASQFLLVVEQFPICFTLDVLPSLPEWEGILVLHRLLLCPQL